MAGIQRSRPRAVVGGLLAVVVAAACLSTVAATPAAAERATPRLKAQDRPIICHRTKSPANPYNQVVVANPGALDGHAAHRGPVFEPGLERWGDIIPPIRPGLPLGRDWPAGREIWENGCEVPADIGSLPSASLGAVACAPAGPTLVVRAANAPDATQPAEITVLVDGAAVETVGPLAPGESETVTLSTDLAVAEDRTFTVEVRSDGEVLASRVVTVDCVGDQPALEIDARVTCAGLGAVGVVSVRNNTTAPVTVTATVDGASMGDPVVVAPGAATELTIGLARYEDQTIVGRVLVDGSVRGTWTVTPDCRAPRPRPRASVRVQCDPSVAVVRLANTGDPDSSSVFTIRVNGRLYGGHQTTIVKNVERFEGRGARVTIRSAGRVILSRRLRVDCRGTGPVVVGPSRSVPG